MNMVNICSVWRNMGSDIYNFFLTLQLNSTKIKKINNERLKVRLRTERD